MKAAAENLTSVTLELGGKSPRNNRSRCESEGYCWKNWYLENLSIVDKPV